MGFPKSMPNTKPDFPWAHRPVSRPVRFAFCTCEKSPSKWNLFPFPRLFPRTGGLWAMLVERGVRILNMGVVGDAYAIAANYLRRAGAIPDDFVTNDRLLEIIVQMFHRGESNKIRLANLAIAKFEAAQAVDPTCLT
jgi:hypothetical protein